MTVTYSSPAAAPAPELLDARGAAALLAVSPRHLYRLADAGRCPAPIRLGAAVRWRRAELLDWLNDGAPSVRKGARP